MSQKHWPIIFSVIGENQIVFCPVICDVISFTSRKKTGTRYHPGPQSRSAPFCPLLPAPAQPDPLPSTDFSPQNSFPPWTYPVFPVIYRIFPSRRLRGKNLITSQKLGGKAKLSYCIKALPRYPPLCTAQNALPWSIVALQLSANT